MSFKRLFHQKNKKQKQKQLFNIIDSMPNTLLKKIICKAVGKNNTKKKKKKKKNGEKGPQLKTI